MKAFVYALGALAIATTAARADVVTQNTITGYAASSAIARGVPLDGSATPRLNAGPGFRHSAVEFTSQRQLATVK